MNQKNPLFSILTFMFLPLPAALACRCVEPSLKTAYARADAVAQVRIYQVSEPSSDGTVTAQAEVLNSWKTKLPSRIQIWTGEDCAYALRAEEHYVLYLSRGDDRWGTYKCRGNRIGANAAATVSWLNRHTRLIAER